MYVGVISPVTLYTRVWIEIPDFSILSKLSFVTLYTRVWIEIDFLNRKRK